MTADRNAPSIRGFFIFALLALTAVSAPGRSVRVRPDGHGDAPRIQDAIAAAAPGDTVLLASGTYAGPGNRDIRLAGKLLTIRSHACDPESCVIDCESKGRGFDFDGDRGRGTVHPRVEGITITNGRAETGGAVLCARDSSPVIWRCILRGNRADSLGGAIGCVETSGLLTLVDCTIAGNSAGRMGGAIRLCCCSEASLENCTIVGNSAPEGSAFSCVGHSYLAMSRTIIAFQAGGSAAQCREGSCDPKITFCDIFGNAGGDWVGCLAPLAGVKGNVSVDPQFRSRDGEDFRLIRTSPLAPGGFAGVRGMGPTGLRGE